MRARVGAERPAADSLLSRNAALERIIRPLPKAANESGLPWDGFEDALSRTAEGFGEVDMAPDFQRANVWCADQQRAWIEAALRRAIPSSGYVVQFNCQGFVDGAHPGTSDLARGFQCVDGLQRITAVTSYLAGEIRPFGLTLEDLAGSSYHPARMSYRFKVLIYSMPTRQEVLGHYLALNTGGTAHAPREIERVRALLAEAIG